MQGDSESSQEARDIMKEFVDMSFDRAKESGDHQNSLDEKGGSPKRELEECLQKINVEISGKILQTKNGIVILIYFKFNTAREANGDKIKF